MIEKIVRDYLKKELKIRVELEKPSPMPNSLVLIEKTGGSEEQFLYYATIAIQSYSTTLLKAAELNEAVKKAMRNLATLDDIAKCSLNSDYNFSNTITKEYRYQAVFNIIHY